jgi:hypothetical protein
MTPHLAAVPDPASVNGPDASWLALATHDALTPGEPGQEATQFAVCALGPDPEAACEGRRFATGTLREWGMAPLVEDASLVVAELLSNAIRHGLTSVSGADVGPHPVWLGLLRRGESVLCTVSDPSRAVPVVREPDDEGDESGRGLHVVDAISESWGWTPPDRAGKAVWAMMRAPLAG